VCEYRGGKPPCAMKVTVVGPFGALSAGHNPSGERSECEQLKFGNKFLLKPNIGGNPIAYKYREGKICV